jgi:hypothetical protein
VQIQGPAGLALQRPSDLVSRCLNAACEQALHKLSVVIMYVEKARTVGLETHAGGYWPEAAAVMG